MSEEHDKDDIDLVFDDLKQNSDLIMRSLHKFCKRSQEIANQPLDPALNPEDKNPVLQKSRQLVDAEEFLTMKNLPAWLGDRLYELSCEELTKEDFTKLIWQLVFSRDIREWFKSVKDNEFMNPAEFLPEHKIEDNRCIDQWLVAQGFDSNAWYVIHTQHPRFFIYMGPRNSEGYVDRVDGRYPESIYFPLEPGHFFISFETLDKLCERPGQILEEYLETHFDNGQRPEDMNNE